jgi:3-deoxy-7-phosphoheptulonate synthase
MIPTNDLRVIETVPLLSPSHIKADLPITEPLAALVSSQRKAIRDVLSGHDGRMLAVVGPCSIHDPDAALDYARRLAVLRERFQDELVIVMRMYFEKPRTRVGWKGLINDPHLDGTFDISLGLRMAREALLGVTTLGLPTATEMLDPIVPQYIADLVCWAAIGARTTESQTHREMASGLSMPVGFKNATDGGVEVAVNAIVSAARPHHFLGIDGQGLVSIVNTQGNPDCHLVLRGGSGGPNYDRASVTSAAKQLAQAGANPGIIVDCSHDNSGKKPECQPQVLSDVIQQLEGGVPSSIVGVMIESQLVAGAQKPGLRSELIYGMSITDGCIDLSTTETMLSELAHAARRRRVRAA